MTAFDTLLGSIRAVPVHVLPKGCSAILVSEPAYMPAEVMTAENPSLAYRKWLIENKRIVFLMEKQKEKP